jgi:hypothetical protein
LPQGLDAAFAADGEKLRAGAGPVRVYLDGSESMAGYAAGADADVRPLGDIIEVLGSTSAQRHAGGQFVAFGKTINPIPGGRAGAARYATAAAYTCKGCDNKESHIDAVLHEIAASDRGSVNVVVTDFWLDNKSFVGSPQVALGAPLTEMLRQGRTIGIFGLRAPFKGRIFDFPNGGVYADAAERPLFVLIIGPQPDVAAIHDALQRSNSPAFRPERTRYSVFATRLGRVWAPATSMRPTGGGASTRATIPPELLPRQQQFALQLDAARAQQGRIEGVYGAGAGLHDNMVWSGPLKASTRVWRLGAVGDLRRCSPATWREIGPLSRAWTPAGGSGARLTVSPATAPGLLPGGSYFVAGYLGVRKLQVPNPADGWMRDWSFSASQESALRARKPRFFPTLNLADFAQSLESALDGAAPNGTDTVALGFVVRVDR